MKLRLIPLLFICTAAVAQSEPAVPEENSAEPANHTASDIIQQEIEKILQGVHDKESADAAADKLLDLINDLHQHPGITEVDLVVASNKKIEEEEARLEAVHYYGSTKLAANRGNVTTAYVPQELTPEAAAEVEQILRAVIGKLPGGPGFSRETAWRIPAEFCTQLNQETDSDCRLTPYEELVIDLNRADERLYCPITDSRLGIVDGKLYERHPMQALLQGKLYHFEIWFDLTEGHDVPTSEEYRAAYAACTRQLQETVERLSNVHDKDSADEAAAWLSTQVKLWQPKYHPMTVNGAVPGCVQTVNALKMRIYELRQELGSKHFYGSSALTILLYQQPIKGIASGRHRLSKEDFQARQDMKRRERTDYVRLLEQLLPSIRDQATAMAAARKLSACDMNICSHISLLQREDICKQVDTLPIRRHLKRVTNAGFFGSADLADILRERNTLNGINNYIAPEDDVEPAE